MLPCNLISSIGPAILLVVIFFNTFGTFKTYIATLVAFVVQLDIKTLASLYLNISVDTKSKLVEKIIANTNNVA